MTTTTRKMGADEVGKFFTNLCGIQITATEAPALVCDTFGALAVYVDDEEEVKGQILCDLSAAAMLGAALTLIPKSAVEDAIEAGKLAENLRENLCEVLNIAVNLFPRNLTHRLVLKEVIVDEGAAASLTTEFAPMNLSIQRYGSCNLFIATTV